MVDKEGGVRKRKRPRPPKSPGRRGWLTMLTAALLSAIPSHAFLAPTSSMSSTMAIASTTRQLMIGHVFGINNNGGDPQLPKDVKDAVSQCCGAVQKCLEDRISRMDVEMPLGTNFGVENTKVSKSKRGDLSLLTGGDERQEGLTMEKLATSNRELARLFVEMFQPLGGQHIAAVFNDQYLADQARQRWSQEIRAECNILAIDRKGKPGGLQKRGKKGKKKNAKGFATKMAEELGEDGSLSGPLSLPEGTEVALFISPGPKELITVERICSEVGMEMCIILLNARLSYIEKFLADETRKLFTEEFETVWWLSAAPQEEAPGCLMHRAYPGPWVLARKPKVGPPKTIALKEGDKFSRQECEEAFKKIQLSELEKGAEKLAENMAGWFK